MSTPTEIPIDYVSGSQRYLGLLKRAAGKPRATVVLLPDWRGQSALAHSHADHLVALGCTVAIADLYGDGFTPDNPNQVGPLVQRLLDQRQRGVESLKALVARLRAAIPAGTPLVCLGFSAGGMIALDYARSGADVSGVILCSALLKTAAPGMETRIRAPILVLQGTQDQVAPMATIAEVIAEMDRAGNQARFELYTQTHHAFDNPDAGNDPQARLVYSPTSARRARQAIAEFIAALER